MSATNVSARFVRDNQPIARVEQYGEGKHVIVSKNAELTVAFRLELPEIFSLSQQDLLALHDAFVGAISVLPDDTLVHKQDWYTDAKYSAELPRDVEVEMSRRASERHFAGRPILKHESYLFLTKVVRRRVKSLASTLMRTKVVSKEVSDPAAQEAFFSAIANFERVVSDTGRIRVRRLTPDDIAGTSAAESGAERAGIIERYLTLAEDERPVLRDLDLTDGLKIGDKRCKLFTISNSNSLPGLVSPGISVSEYSSEVASVYMSLGNCFGIYCDVPHLYNQYILVENDKVTRSNLEGQQRRMLTYQAVSPPNGVYARQIGQFLESSTADQSKIVRTHANLLVWGESREQLKDNCSIVTAAFTKGGVTPKEEAHSLPTIFWAGIPGNAGDLPHEEYFPSLIQEAACLFTLESNYRSSRSPAGIRFVDRLTGYPVSVDLSDEPRDRGLIANRNKLIIGPSGTGKSFLTNHLVDGYHAQGSHVLLVDVGGSYSGTCEYVGGTYISYDEDSPIQFNPFYLAEGETLDTEKVESLKQLIVTIWKTADATLAQSEYMTLSNAITGFYEHCDETGTFPKFDSFYDYVEGPFSKKLQAQRVREKDFDLQNFLYVLSAFHSDGGTYGYLLNSEERLDLLSERFIVFELDNVKDHPVLFPVVTLVIMDVFIRKMRKLPGDVRKIICIEEAWKALMKESMADFIKYLFKTVRKFYGEAWVVTQDVEDLIASPFVKQAIVANSDVKVLMDLRKFANRFDDITDLLGLSEKDVAQVLSVNSSPDPRRRYKECFIALGSSYSNVYGVEVPIESYLKYTTEKPEKEAVQILARRYGSIERGIRALADLARSEGSLADALAQVRSRHRAALRHRDTPEPLEALAA